MIRIFDDRKLAAELRDGQVSEYQKLVYFLLITVWALIAASKLFTDMGYAPGDRSDHWTDILNFVINIVGITLCFDVNKAGDNRNFIERLTCLNFPINNQAVLLQALIAIPGVWAVKRFDLAIEEKHILYISGLVVLPYYFWRACGALRIASASRDARQ